MPILESLNNVATKKLNCIPTTRGRSNSRVIIHEKWGRATPDILGPGTRDLERLKLEEGILKRRLRWLNYGIRAFQIFSSYFPSPQLG